MKFKDCSNNKRIQIIIRKCNELLQSQEFYEAMSVVKGFNPKYTSSDKVDGPYICDRLKGDASTLEVYTFKSRNPFTSSNGYTVQDKFTRMFLNTRKFNRSDASMAATIFHEAVHEADNNDPIHFYHHGDNVPKGDCAPEVVADVVYKLLSGLRSTEDSSIK